SRATRATMASMKQSASAAMIAVRMAKARAGARIKASGTLRATFHPLSGAVAQYTRRASFPMRSDAKPLGCRATNWPSGSRLASPAREVGSKHHPPVGMRYAPPPPAHRERVVSSGGLDPAAARGEIAGEEPKLLERDTRSRHTQESSIGAEERFGDADP